MGPVLLPVGSRVFVDESKARGYFLAAVAVPRGDVQATASALRKLLRPGQNRIHFKSESDSSRRELLAAMCELEVSAVVYRMSGARELEARRACLELLVTSMVESGARELILESAHASINARDRRVIRDQLQTIGALDAMSYDHRTPRTEPLLWVADAVAWCAQARGDWIRRSEPLVQSRVELAP